MQIFVVDRPATMVHKMVSSVSREAAILHKCEQMYYTNLLEQRKSNLGETWKIIKELLHRQDSNHNIIPLVINGVMIADPLMIANNFNNYFALIGPNMANTIPTANCHY